MGQKAVFLDRDGVLDVDTGYISRPEQVQWVPGAKTALARLHKLGYAVFVVTNQSGIARGYYTVEDMKVLHAFMAKEIEKSRRSDYPFLLLSPPPDERDRQGTGTSMFLP